MTGCAGFDVSFSLGYNGVGAAVTVKPIRPAELYKIETAKIHEEAPLPTQQK